MAIESRTNLRTWRAIARRAAAFGNAKGGEGQKIANLIVNRKINIETLSPIQLIESILKIDDSKSLKMEPAELEATCFEIISQNQRAAEDYRQGKKQSLQFLLGLVLKKFKGKAEPTEVATVLEALMSANYLSHDVIPDSIRNPEEPGSWIPPTAGRQVQDDLEGWNGK